MIKHKESLVELNFSEEKNLLPLFHNSIIMKPFLSLSLSLFFCASELEWRQDTNRQTDRQIPS